ncbi:MAG: hypothetical protein ACKVUS_21600 [Saprospiraceae bacterium]
MPTQSYSLLVKEERRLAAWQIIDPIYGNFSLVMLHFQSRLHWSEADQNAHSSKLKLFIDDLEKQVSHDRTVVLGDFNMNPFQFGMVQAFGLHTTMDRRMAEMGSRMVDRDSYKFFYNPMWSFFGEKGKGQTNGTYFYRSANPIAYFWNIFDQVILRPSLLPAFDEDSLQILTNIRQTSLLNHTGVVDKNISDHLPVVFNLNLNLLKHDTSAKPVARHAG